MSRFQNANCNKHQDSLRFVIGPLIALPYDMATSQPLHLEIPEEVQAVFNAAIDETGIARAIAVGIAARYWARSSIRRVRWHKGAPLDMHATSHALSMWLGSEI